jgi:hypothetical protein
MQGQWIGKIEGEFNGTLRVEIELRRGRIVGNAYLFYDPVHALPGFVFYVNMDDQPPHTTEVTTVYCYTDGGRMTREDRVRAEAGLTERFGSLPIPDVIKVHFKLLEPHLILTWSTDGQTTEELKLVRSDIESQTTLVGRTDIATWDNFRQWAVGQKPRQFIFRGQSEPTKLTTTFHRTWRKDLNSWVVDDVRLLFGAIIERVSYPLQLGNLDHNAAFWSILQHHGYPTPLLDWTFSPFVAAYFAFQGITPGSEKHPRIYIFDAAAWNEKYGRLRFTVDAAPSQLTVLESIPVGNPRAAPQQALSTVSNIADIEGFVRERELEDGKTYLTACDIPIAETPNIMRELELMGITYGSLFPGLDGMCKDMRDRLFNLDA